MSPRRAPWPPRLRACARCRAWPWRQGRGLCAACSAFRAHAIRVYTPHGGSLHYRPGSIAGSLYITLEKILKARTDLFLFESEYIRELFNRRIGAPRAMVKVVRNGVAESEFAEVAPAPSATDLLYIGELRSIKGVDVLIDAIADLRATGPTLTATIVGDGPDREALRARAKARGISDLVRFRTADAGARGLRARQGDGRAVATGNPCPMSCSKPAPPRSR